MPYPTRPPSAPGTWVVWTGDSLYGIAVAVGVSEDQLRWWNLDRYPSLRSNPDSIAKGWILITTGPPMPTAVPRPSPVPAPLLTPAPVIGASNGLVSLPWLSVDVWNALEEYFGISGRNPQELIESATANSPPQCHDDDGDGAACAGPTIWSFEPTYFFDPFTGSCTLTGASANVSFAAYLPQWTAPAAVPPELLSWWQLVLEHIRWHEEQHIRIFVDYASQLPDLLAGHPCDDGQAITNTWASNLQVAQDAFDAQDDSWPLPPYSGPWSW
jgi:predicted secreted Zn-dependent protease